MGFRQQFESAFPCVKQSNQTIISVLAITVLFAIVSFSRQPRLHELSIKVLGGFFALANPSASKMVLYYHCDSFFEQKLENQ